MRAGFAGETASPMLPSSPAGRPVLCVSSVQCSPPSEDLKTPPPAPPAPPAPRRYPPPEPASVRAPVRTYSTAETATPMSPATPAATPLLCVSSVQCSPPSEDLKTPPPVVPIQYSLGRAAEPATATLRPPRKIPISRHLRAAKTVESYGAT